MRDQLLGDRYRLVRQLGEGGMGQVWEAQDETLGRPVAVKVISLLAGGGSRGDEARTRFLREARITAQLQHTNIVTVHDLGETGTGDSKVPFLVMELVQGEGLDAKLRRGPVTLPETARWAAQISDALAAAHDAGIMHRDIKPSNILITPSGNVKVLDFGVARAADPDATADRLTQTGFIVGTPRYMAPEQARGFPEPRSDLYALGCLTFELITGRMPFQAPDTVGYLSAHLTQEPPAPSSVSTGIPSAWDDLVLTLLNKDPNQRHPTAADLAQALRQLDLQAAPSQEATGDGDARLTQTQVATVQMPPTASLNSFQASWTGQEPLSTYAGRPRTWIHWVLVLLLSALSAACVYFAPPGEGIGLAIKLGGGITSGFYALSLVIYAITGRLAITKDANAPRVRWALHVGPQGIAISTAAERVEIPWGQIRKVGIRKIQGSSPYRYTGLHIAPEDGVESPAMPPPGWPHPWSDTVPVPSLSPVCVLGPMTQRQRTELMETLAGYGGRRWDPSVLRFTTPPVDL